MVRNATVADMQGIAKVHMACFPESLFTVLGKGSKGRLLEKFYMEYMNKVPELFLVAENDNGEIVGLCMGYYCEDNVYRKMFFKHNFLGIAFTLLGQLIVGNKVAWKKLRENFSKKEEQPEILNDEFKSFSKTQKGDLLSICVTAECRGTSTATDLVNLYESKLKEKGREVCLLSVKEDNARAIAFYKKMGYECYMKADGNLHMAKKI